MSREQDYQKRLDEILAQAPVRAPDQTEEEYREMVDGWRHRVGPTIRTLRSLVSQHTSKSPDTAKSKPDQ